MAINNPRHLVGNFNAHLRDCVFLFADEFFAGDARHTAVLKSLITEDSIPIEGKFQNAIEAPNFLHIMMASNERWVVPASLEARRFFVLSVDPCVRGRRDYFDALHAEMEAGGYEAMLHDLLQYDLTGFDVREVPETEGLREQKHLSLSTEHAWWRACLERGYVFESRLGLHDYFGVWHPKVCTQLLFKSYAMFARARGERRCLHEGAFGKFLLALGATQCRWRGCVAGEEIRNIENPSVGTSRQAVLIRLSGAKPAYDFGDLETARATFERATGLAIEDLHAEAEEVD